MQSTDRFLAGGGAETLDRCGTGNVVPCALSSTKLA
jgi:hypothetical protein